MKQNIFSVTYKVIYILEKSSNVFFFQTMLKIPSGNKGVCESNTGNENLMLRLLRSIFLNSKINVKNLGNIFGLP